MKRILNNTRFRTLRTYAISTLGPFKCYVTQWGGGGGGGGVSAFPEKKCYEDVGFNVISVTRGWVGVKLPGKKALHNT